MYTMLIKFGLSLQGYFCQIIDKLIGFIDGEPDKINLKWMDFQDQGEIIFDLGEFPNVFLMAIWLIIW